MIILKKYTYRLSSVAQSDIYKEIKYDIALLYPEFEHDRKITEADGSECTIHICRSTGEQLIIEISYTNNCISVISDVPLPELADKYAARSVSDNILHTEINAESAGKAAAHIKHHMKQIRPRYLLNPMFIKAFALPVVLLVSMSLAGRSASAFAYKEIYSIIRIFSTVLLSWLICCLTGGLSYIPAVMASRVLAEKEKYYLHKLPFSLMFLFIELCGLIILIVSDDVSFISLHSLKLFFTHIPVSEIAYLYFLLLPVIIADEIIESKHAEIHSQKRSFILSSLWWTGTAAVMLVFFISFIVIVSVMDSYKENTDTENMIAEPERPDIGTIIPPLYEAYGEDMTAVAAYATEHDIYDWYYCPDDSIYDHWYALFGDTGENGSDFGIKEKLQPAENDGKEAVVFMVHMNGTPYSVYLSSDGTSFFDARYSSGYSP